MKELEPRTLHCVRFLEDITKLEGDVIELGVCKGTTIIAMASKLKELNSDKKVFACDTFNGIPEDDIFNFDRAIKKGECRYSLDRFLDNVKQGNVEDMIIPVEGLIQDTLYPQLGDKMFSFAWIDMDIYEPTSYALEFLTNRIVKGGIVGFHDYKFSRCPGIEIVVDTEIDTYLFERVLEANTCVFFRRK